MQITETTYGGHNCLKLDNGALALWATTAVGPRIMLECPYEVNAQSLIGYGQAIGFQDWGMRQARSQAVFANPRQPIAAPRAIGRG